MTPPKETIDHEARKTAEIALTKIADHTEQCAKLWKITQGQFKALFRRMNWIVGLLVTGLGGVVMILLTILGYVLVNGVPWQ